MATLPGDAVFRGMTYPAELTGKTNGKLPSTILRTISYPGGGSGVFCSTAARAFTAMLDAMGKAGFKMMTVGGYRTYQQQVNLFLSRYHIVSYNSGLWWNGNWWAINPGVAVAAKPGTSNHGWGLADDMAENLDTDPSAEGISQKAVDWLVRNADRYGISAELRSEAWHWRYYKGDAIPQAVLDFEKGSGEEEEVAGYSFRVDGADPSIWWVSDGMRRRQVPGGGYRGTLNGKGVVKDIGVLPRVTADSIAANEEAYGGPVDPGELAGEGGTGVTEAQARTIASEVVAGSNVVPPPPAEV